MTTESSSSDSYSRFKGWDDASFGRYKRHWAEFYRREIEACRGRDQPAARALRMLEIGFGNGAFLGWARDQGHEVFGVEIERARLEAAVRAGFRAARSIEELGAFAGPEGLDVVVAFDVFEHLDADALISLLRQLSTILRPGGTVVARFPNGDSPFGRLNQHGDLTHRTAIGTVAVQQLAVEAGFTLERVGSPPLPLRRVGAARSAVHLLSLAIRTGFELPIQILLNAYYPGVLRWYPLAPNLMARLRKPASSEAALRRQEA